MKSAVIPTTRPKAGALRLVAVWAAAFVVSAVGNSIAAAILRGVLNVPSNFAQMSTANVVSITAVGVAAAVIVFAIVVRLASHPVQFFTFVVAPIGLVVSWLFDLALYVTKAFPGTTGRGVIGLMLLHVIAGVITVVLLRAHGLSNSEGASQGL